MTDYKVIKTNVVPGLTEVRFYQETVGHIRERHPEVPIELPSIEGALASAISDPTHVEKSYGGSYVFVDANSTNRSGDPFRVAVKPVEEGSGRVRTAYFASTDHEPEIIWRSNKNAK
ncbi:hypothetical protein [Ferrovibrio terrae]|uniref:hypothetical protein n=1 Tax=Ferrovibrio terrae TaxID=2594003 RepID=UPI0031381804